MLNTDETVLSTYLGLERWIDGGKGAIDVALKVRYEANHTVATTASPQNDSEHFGAHLQAKTLTDMEIDSLHLGEVTRDLFGNTPEAKWFAS